MACSWCCLSPKAPRVVWSLLSLEHQPGTLVHCGDSRTAAEMRIFAPDNKGAEDERSQFRRSSRRLLDAVDAGSSVWQTVARFGVGVAKAIRWVQRWRESGERTARKQGHPIRSKLGVALET